MRYLFVLGTLLWGSVALAAPQTIDGDNIYCNGKVAPIASVAISTASDTTLVSAVAGKHVRVLGYVVTAGGTQTVRWQGTNATAHSGVMDLGANTQQVVSCFPGYCFRTDDSAGLNIDVSAAVNTMGFVTYAVCDN